MPYIGLAILTVIFWLYCFFDTITSDPAEVRNLSKTSWVFIVILLPTLGSIAWILLGRPKNSPLDLRSRIGSEGLSPPASRAPIRQSSSESGRPVGPEDSAEFLQSIERQRNLLRWEEDLRQREEELRRQHGEDGPNSGN